MRARQLPAAIVAAMIVLTAPVAGQTPESVPTCADFDAWVWAQTVYEADPAATGATLDPDGDTIACPDLPLTGFAPVRWTDAIPAAAVPAVVVGVTDGNTLVVEQDGSRETIRLSAVNAPATFNLGGLPECGGGDATTHLSYILAFAPDDTVYLEPGEPARSADGHRQAYVWYALDGDIYLVNEAMLRGGWASLADVLPTSAYASHLQEAAAFGQQKGLGVWLRCGGFDRPLGATPTAEQVADARLSQPDQGQLPSLATPAG